MNEKVSINIEIDNLHILSVNDKDEVILKSSVIDHENDTEEDCVVYIERCLFNDMIKEWLDGKQDYYTRGCGFAGVGYITLEAIAEFPEDERCYLNIFHGESDNESDWYVEKKYVRTFSACDFCVDMEHG